MEYHYTNNLNNIEDVTPKGSIKQLDLTIPPLGFER